MKNRINGHELFGHLVKNLERKAPNGSVPKLIEGDGKGSWLALDGPKACLDAAKKFFAKPGLAIFVPTVRFEDIPVGVGRERDAFKHALRAPAASLVPK